MKAIILAGGVGSRLRPMTCDCPKPMVPVADRPVMEYAVRLLEKHGVRDIAATLCYLPEKIRAYFGSGKRFGVNMHYYMENEPLGTAGGVKLAQDFLDETFFVLSGDGLTDCDLTEALRFHREKHAAATIVLKETAVPTEYGVALLEKDGKIKNFLEKPDWSDVLSDLVNTGIYILEPGVLGLVPENTPADFSRDLFPKLMQSGAGVYGYVMQGYWCDIGGVESYLGANRAVLSGETKVAPEGGFVHETARIDEGAVLEHHCYIGENAVVERGAHITAGSVVGKGAHVGKKACVKRSVLWQGASLQENAQASGCVLCDGAMLENDSCAYESAVIGKNSILGAGGMLMPGVKMWPGKRVEEFSRVGQDVVWGSGSGLKFRAGRMHLQSAQQALRLGQALSKNMPGAFALADDGDPGSRCCKQALLAGLCTRSRTHDALSAPLPVLREVCRLLHTSAGAYCTGGSVLVLSENGALPAHSELRSIEKSLCAEQMPEGFDNEVPPVHILSGAQELYLGGIAAHFSGGDAAFAAPAAVFAPDEAILQLAKAAFERTGRPCRAEFAVPKGSCAGETGFLLDGAGKLVKVFDASASVQDEMLRILLLWTALEAGERNIPLNQAEGEALHALLQKYGAQTISVHSGEGEEQSEMSRRAPFLLRLHTDGIFAALAVLQNLEKHALQLWDWQALLPRAAVVAQTVPVETARKGKVLRILAEQFPDCRLGDGVHIRTKAGSAWVRPSSDSALCHIRCEAADMESAQQLLENCKKLIAEQE